MISDFIYSNDITDSSLYFYDEDFLFYYVCKKLNEKGPSSIDEIKKWIIERAKISNISVNDSYTASTSDRFLTNASYLCLQNFNVAYNLPKQWLNKIGIGGVKLYVTGDNLWVWSKRQGLDPRQSVSGSITSAYYAPVRTISGGLTVTF